MERVGITFTLSYMPLSEKLLLGRLCVALRGAFRVSSACGTAHLLSSRKPSCVMKCLMHNEGSSSYLCRDSSKTK